MFRSSLSRQPLAAWLLSATLIAMATPAFGQESHWGVTASLSPTAKAADSFFKTNLINFEGEGEVRSAEWTIGLVRGSRNGGDWGVSLVQKSFEDGSSSLYADTSCFGDTCSTFTETRTMRDVRFKGVEFHWSPAFVTIKDRVQIGMNIGGGVAQVSGIVHELQVSETPGFPPFVSDEDRPASEVLYATQPLVKIEAQGSVLIAPGLKVRVAGGFNAPGYGLRIAAVYLFGAR